MGDNMNVITQQLSQLTGGTPAPRASPAPRDSAPAQPVAPPPTPSTQQVQQAVEQIQRVVAVVAQNLQFSIDQGSGRTVIKIMDTETKEIVRQIPTEEALSIARALDRLQGLLLDGKA